MPVWQIKSIFGEALEKSKKEIFVDNSVYISLDDILSAKRENRLLAEFERFNLGTISLQALEEKYTTELDKLSYEEFRAYMDKEYGEEER